MKTLLSALYTKTKSVINDRFCSGIQSTEVLYIYTVRSANQKNCLWVGGVPAFLLLLVIYFIALHFDKTNMPVLNDVTRLLVSQTTGLLTG